MNRARLINRAIFSRILKLGDDDRQSQWKEDQQRAASSLEQSQSAMQTNVFVLCNFKRRKFKIAEP